MDSEVTNTYRWAAASLLHEIAIHPYSSSHLSFSSHLSSSSSSSPSLFSILYHVFPAYLVKAIIKFEPDEIITLFDTNTASSEFIWNEKTRKEVITFVKSKLSENTNLLETKFTYSEYEKELQVGNIYLNQYSKSPSPFTVTSPAGFLHSLFSALSTSFSSSFSPSSLLIIKSLQNLLSAYPELLKTEITEKEILVLIDRLRIVADLEELQITLHCLLTIAEKNTDAFYSDLTIQKLQEMENDASLSEPLKAQISSWLSIAAKREVSVNEAEHSQNGVSQEMPEKEVSYESPEKEIHAESPETEIYESPKKEIDSELENETHDGADMFETKPETEMEEKAKEETNQAQETPSIYSEETNDKIPVVESEETNSEPQHKTNLSASNSNSFSN